MDFVERMNKAIKYVEDNLLEEIDYSKLAMISGTSSAQFQRIFSAIADVSLFEYIRRRRLTLAAFELQNTNQRIIDIAIKYGYESHEAFSRAFQKVHGIPPSKAKFLGETLKAYPSISFKITIKGVAEMNYRIEEKESFKMFGLERIIPMENEENFVEIPKFWSESMGNGDTEKLADDSGYVYDPKVGGILPVNAIMCYKDTGKDSFPYMIGAFVGENSKTDGYEVAVISKGQWAIFKTDNYNNTNMVSMIQELWRRIYSEWFPSSGYDHAEMPELELYYENTDKTGYCEVWIPIVKKVK